MMEDSAPTLSMSGTLFSAAANTGARNSSAGSLRLGMAGVHSCAFTIDSLLRLLKNNTQVAEVLTRFLVRVPTLSVPT